jgi:threonine/homoserine/homoserine lactone efflux protein
LSEYMLFYMQLLTHFQKFMRQHTSHMFMQAIYVILYTTLSIFYATSICYTSNTTRKRPSRNNGISGAPLYWCSTAI